MNAAREDAFDDYATSTPPDAFGPPEFIEIEPIHSCNLRCVMCHVSYEKLSKVRLDPGIVEKFDGLAGKWAVVGGEYEPMVHPRIVEILTGLSSRGLKIDLTTNGTMFDEATVAALADVDFRRVTISFDGVSKDVYEKVRRRADHARVLEGVERFRRMALARNPGCRFILNYTVLRSNVAEMAEAVAFWGARGFDHIGFIGMVRREDNEVLRDQSLQDGVAAFRDQIERIAAFLATGEARISVSNSYGIVPDEVSEGVHARDGVLVPARQDAWWPKNPRPIFQSRAYPGMPVACSSAHKAMRISYDGTITLCTRFRIGNIYEATSVLDAWNGARAAHVRKTLPERPQVCLNCDYFRLCVNAGRIDPKDPASHELDAAPHSRELGPLCDRALVAHGHRIHAFPADQPAVDVALGDCGPETVVVEARDPQAAFAGLRAWVEKQWGPGEQLREGAAWIWRRGDRYAGIGLVPGERALHRALRVRHGRTPAELERRLTDPGAADPSEGLPMRVLTHGRYSVVKYAGRYFGVPDFLGRLDVDRAPPEKSRYFLGDDRLDRLIARMRASPDPRPDFGLAGRLVKRFGGRALRRRLLGLVE
jgi:radical SAM protein with 4Fe4S-binding SPASM domain